MKAGDVEAISTLQLLMGSPRPHGNGSSKKRKLGMLVARNFRKRSL